jgi:hypothetical protein
MRAMGLAPPHRRNMKLIYKEGDTTPQDLACHRRFMRRTRVHHHLHILTLAIMGRRHRAGPRLRCIILDRTNIDIHGTSCPQFTLLSYQFMTFDLVLQAKLRSVGRRVLMHRCPSISRTINMAFIRGPCRVICLVPSFLIIFIWSPNLSLSPRIIMCM